MAGPTAPCVRTAASPALGARRSALCASSAALAQRVHPRSTAAPARCRWQSRGALVTLALAQRCEYVWSDGQGEGTKGPHGNSLRSKTKVLQTPVPVGGTFPDWAFDGSSTGQAEGRDSDCILRPVFSCPDPIRGGNNLLVLCEVMTSDATPHASNARAQLRAILDAKVAAEAPLFGFEQEYTMIGKNGRVFGWPESGFPAPQGPFYCGTGLEEDACMKAGLTISGINAEVMPGQWEFQIGPTGPLDTGDQVLVARWLLHRLGEDFGITASLAAKPVPGEWNGAGAHTNFSTEAMRRPGGITAINAAIEKLSQAHAAHIAVYGSGNEARLTGKCETCDIATFKAGVADRGCSVRIPKPVQLAGCGYFEDRRPAANVDPYTVVRMLISTILK